jgi:hypothetical protein
MEFAFWPAVLAGFVGGLVMTAMMTMMRQAGKTKMDMALLQGAMFTDERGKARAIGLFAHLVMMSALAFGSLYAVLLAVFDVASGDAWWVGALIGLLHGILAGMAMGMMPALHPRMRAEAGAAVGGRSAHSLELDPPGLFAKNHGSATPAGIVLAHVVYGLVVGLMYAFVAT